MAKVKCPVCDEAVDIGEEPEAGTEIECPYCGTKLLIARKGRRWILEVSEETEEEEWSEESEWS